MSLTEYTLDKEFDILATWFRIGEIYEDGVKGKLHYSSASIVLDVYDSFADSSVEKGKEITYLYGISTKGQLLILNNCLRVGEDTTSLGFAIESYAIETFYILDVIGEIPIEYSFSEVESIQFSLEHLDSWINPNVMDLLVDLERTETQGYPIQAEGLIVTTGVNHHRKRKKRAIVLEENYFLELRDKSGKTRSLDSFFKDASLVKKLIEFLNNSFLAFAYVGFTFTQGKGRYFFKQIETQQPHLPHYRLTLDRIENEFANILNHWFLKADKFDLIIDNYLNDLYLDYYIETKLVNSIRNLEVYYRNFVRDPHYIEERREALKADQQLLLEFVEHEISEKYKQHFIRNILYIGEESLRVKLNHLMKGVPEQLFIMCIKQAGKSPSKSRSSFTNKLMETRNFYTHGDQAEKYPDRLTDSNDLLLVNEKLKLFQRYYIYQELGFPKELLLSILLSEAEKLE